MADQELDFTFVPHDPTDTKWYENRELGQPDDPYNKNCKNIPKENPLYAEYISIGQQLCDQLETDILTNEDEGWIFMSESDGVTVHKKENEGSSILTFKGSTVIPSTPEMIRLWLIQTDQRIYWDPTFVQGTYELEAEVHARVASYLYSAPWPVSYRDFVVVASEAIRDNGLFIAGAHSVEHEDFPATEHVRGTIYSSGFVIKPLPTTEEGIPQCQVWYTGTIDPAGWIPVSVSNIVNSSQPMNLAKLRDLIVNVSALIRDVLTDLFALEDGKMTSSEIKQIFEMNLEKHGLNEHPDILYDAMKNFFLQKRIGPTNEELLSAMEKEGKKKTMTKLFKAFGQYIRTIRGGKELISIAEKYFNSQ
eukprot:CAMPEP_0201484346 /NCGR_PEP_ID=MMETSP0151_2-20130828/8536_1 /ASSEMBLY_ACC=CAM_ASM_000257 /TAXON_ID=200890 /ORGANISM="Paramoeba atlantica, Strain 621/1 / CCAP 1560/9" /LENGTH=362 /DNA_ID=CAMNT_0047867977 /DNA_START=123 /DNA_END=1211 /DNA_ORIENTATION=-